VIKRLQPGDILENKYLILKQLGQGGMGAVFEGQHKDLHMKVAIKVLLPIESDDPEMTGRFKSEAQAAANIKHPNVIEVYDFGITPDDRPFFVMELLKGESLADLLDRHGPLEEHRIVEILDQILKGLNSAHKHNVIHRDLKPENVFLSQTDDNKTLIKLVDFGIAKIVSRKGNRFNSDEFDNSHEMRFSTERGIVMGTPGYMAPEILTDQKPADARADIFAVGVILFEMLTGRRPFTGDNPHKVMVDTATKPIPLPRAINQSISEPMEQLCLIALAQNPDDRFSSCTEFMDYLTSAAVGHIPKQGRRCRTITGLPSVIPDAPLELSKYKLNSNKRSKKVLKKSLKQKKTEKFTDKKFTNKPYIGKRARTMRRPFLVWPVGKLIFLAGLAGAAIYLFYFKDTFLKVNDTKKHRVSRKRFVNNQKQISYKSSQTNEESITIWVDANPKDSRIFINNQLMTMRPIKIKKGNLPVKVEIIRENYQKQISVITPNRDQTLSFNLKKNDKNRKKRYRHRKKMTR
jgi:serine/threonine protein kinase